MDSIGVKVENVTKVFKFDKPEGLYQSLKNLLNSSKQKRLVALNSVSFKISEGKVLGIIGKNGSGKTTLLRTIAGIYVPNSGRVHVYGRMAPLLQIGTGFQEELIAKENIIISAMFAGIPKNEIKEKVQSIIKFAGLEKFSKTKLKHYSSGMRARLAFSSAIQMDPDILLVDEILSVGDLDFSKKSYEKFLTFKKEGKTILFASHDLDAIKKISDNVLLMDKGKVVVIGEPEKTIEKYLEIVNSH